VLPTDTPSAEPAGVACTVTPPDGWTLYEVRSGDNLTFLASRGKTSVQELMRVNCLDSETIWIGVELYIPATALEESATGRFCDASVPEGWVVYEVRPGDNLTIIALRSGTTVDEIMTMNCLTSADTIVIGTRLYVPETETAPTP
jgi:LysM repeat protein